MSVRTKGSTSIPISGDASVIMHITQDDVPIWPAGPNFTSDNSPSSWTREYVSENYYRYIDTSGYTLYDSSFSKFDNGPEYVGTDKYELVAFDLGAFLYVRIFYPYVRYNSGPISVPTFGLYEIFKDFVSEVSFDKNGYCCNMIPIYNSGNLPSPSSGNIVGLVQPMVDNGSKIYQDGSFGTNVRPSRGGGSRTAQRYISYGTNDYHTPLMLVDADASPENLSINVYIKIKYSSTSSEGINYNSNNAVFGNYIDKKSNTNLSTVHPKNAKYMSHFLFPKFAYFGAFDKHLL